MSAGQRLKGFGCYFTLVIGFVLLLYAFFMPEIGREYKERGIKTQATITSVTGFRSKFYKGLYRDSMDNLVEAEIIVNQLGVMTGDVVEGYILEEEPYKVWCEPPEGFDIFLKCIIGFLLLIVGGGLVIIPVFAIGEKRKERARNKAIWEEGMREYKEESRW